MGEGGGGSMSGVVNALAGFFNVRDEVFIGVLVGWWVCERIVWRRCDRDVDLLSAGMVAALAIKYVLPLVMHVV